jgi:hypothetical protein
MSALRCDPRATSILSDPALPRERLVKATKVAAALGYSVPALTRYGLRDPDFPKQCRLTARGWALYWLPDVIEYLGRAAVRATEADAAETEREAQISAAKQAVAPLEQEIALGSRPERVVQGGIAERFEFNRRARPRVLEMHEGGMSFAEISAVFGRPPGWASRVARSNDSAYTWGRRFALPTKFVVSTRLDAATRDVLAGAAKAAGRSLSEEVEHRLRDHLAKETAKAATP